MREMLRALKQYFELIAYTSRTKEEAIAIANIVE